MSTLFTTEAHLGTGFYRITAKQAASLCNNHPPKLGYEHRCTVEDTPCAIAQTIHKGDTVWSIRRLPDGKIPDSFWALTGNKQ